MSDTVKLVPSVKVTRKESKVTSGTGNEKKTVFVACWDYELFYPIHDGSNIPQTLEWANDTILAARRNAASKEASP